VAKSESKTQYGIGVGFALLMWSAIVAYIPSYFAFEQHWSAAIVYWISGAIGVLGFLGTLHEVFKLWPMKLKSLNENLSAALLLAGVAVLFHFLGVWIEWRWLTVLMKLIALVLIALAATGFAFSTEDAIKSTLTHESASVRKKVWNAIKALAALVVGLLSAGAAAIELLRALG